MENETFYGDGLSNIWQSAASPHIKEARKAAKPHNKNLFF